MKIFFIFHLRSQKPCGKLIFHLNRYELLEREVETHLNHIDQVLLPAGQLNSQNLGQVNSHSTTLTESAGELQNVVAAHKACLTDEAAHLNFNWKADSIETFISQKEVMSEEVGCDVTSCQTLIGHHDNFMASLQSFKETTDALTALKDRLVTSQHAQTRALKQRHGDVMKRWHSLCAESEARKKRLVAALAHFQEIEGLFLKFAEKASEFNGWWENSEEDLTDIIYTSNMDECKKLEKEHTTFVGTLTQSKREEFKELADLDQDIRCVLLCKVISFFRLFCVIFILHVLLNIFRSKLFYQTYIIRVMKRIYTVG